MPNYVKNKLEIIGPKTLVKDVKNFLKGEPYEDGKERLVDFNNIVKCPQVVTDVGEISSNIVYTVKNKYNIPPHKNLLLRKLEMLNRERQRLESLDHEDLIALEKACKAYEATGYIYWYDWNLDNWGTKWNAFSFDYDTPENIIIWKTANAGVIDLIRKISEKFPKVKFIYKWADQDIGNNCGLANIQGGKVKVDIPEALSLNAYELAFELWPGAIEGFTD